MLPDAAIEMMWMVLCGNVDGGSMVAIEMEQQVWLRFGHRDDRGEKENHRGSSINKVKPAPAEKKAKVKP